MRINQFLAKYTELSRRKADDAVAAGRVEINGSLARIGDVVVDTDKVELDGYTISRTDGTITLILHKPAGYVVSRNGQGSRTIYELLPAEYHNLNPVGRLDKDTSGLLLMTNDGDLANSLAHPSHEKEKIYEVSLNKQLGILDHDAIQDKGVDIGMGRPSKLGLKALDSSHKSWQITMKEGRNRQIRRTFDALGYKVLSLHRKKFGDYTLGTLKTGEFSVII